MPLLRKQPFKRRMPARDLKPDDEVFYCEATKEVFKDYDEFFQRTILCNSLVWSCAYTGKSNLTYEEALESEKKAKKRLGVLPKPLKRGLLWLANKTKRGRLADMVDDVYVYAYNRYFKGEIVEAVIKEQWCDCRVLKVIPPTEEEVAKDAQEEAEEVEKERKELEAKGETPKKTKEKKTFLPPDYLFKYQVEEVEPDDPNADNCHVIEAEDVRREKGTFTREKNQLFLKAAVELGKDLNFGVRKEMMDKYKLAEISFHDIFAGPLPAFEETKRLKGFGHSSGGSGRKKNEDKAKAKKGRLGKGQGTLDSWVKGGGGGNTSTGGKSKSKQSAAEVEAEMKRMKEQSQRFKEEMAKRTEEAKKRRLEEKAKEKERKKEETRLLKEVMNEWKKRREDLECDDLKELPMPKPIHCKIPNKLFGDFLTLSEFFHSFSEMLEIENFFSHGVSFDILETALLDHAPGGRFYEVLNLMLQTLFELQTEEDEEVKLEKLSQNIEAMDKSVLGKDVDVANQIKSATAMAHWPMKTQRQNLKDLHLDEWSITEILRLHLQAAGAFRSEKLIMWLYQQRGGYRLSDDPGLQFRMDEPQILEALSVKTVYELNVEERIKILICLMYQILSFAGVRDIIDDRFHEHNETRLELRSLQIAENKRVKAQEEAEKVKRREERMNKKEDDPKEDKKKAEAEAFDPGLTERQRLAIVAQKEKEEKKKQKEEDLRRAEALEKEQQLIAKLGELQNKCSIICLGRDRAYRRFWLLESLPGLYVEHDDDTVGPCLDHPTPVPNPDSRPLSESEAIVKVREILNARGKSPDEKGSSDKENDQNDDRKTPDVSKSYSKKQQLSSSQASSLKQKVLSAKNGALGVMPSTSTEESSSSTSNVEVKTEESEVMEVDATDDDDDQTRDSNNKKLVNNLPWGSCLADPDNCTVHSNILPRTHWAYYSTIEQVDELIESLNDRGIRESELKEKLTLERDNIAKSLRKFKLDAEFNVDTKSKKIKTEETHDDKEAMDEDKKDKEEEKSVEMAIDLTLRDQILELEEKIYMGTLGALKIQDRLKWQEAIQKGGYDKQCTSLQWGGKSALETPFESRVQSAGASRDVSPAPEGGKRDSSGSAASHNSSSLDSRLRKVQDLASAVLQVAQMVDERYLKPPLGEEEKDKKKRLKEEEKRKKEREEEAAAAAAAAEEENGEGQAEHDHSKPVPKILTPMQEWENSLMKCTSYAQVFVHLTTLESSIVWSQSLLNAKCRICRRKTDPDQMLLCDGCNRGHHTFCLKPKLKTIPEGDWFCKECKPTEKVRSPKKKSRRVFSNDNEDEEDDTVARFDDGGEAERASDEAEDSEEEEVQAEEEEVSMQQQVEDEDNLDMDEDDVPLKRSKKKRAVEPAPKKSKQANGTAISANNSTSESNKRTNRLSAFLGGRRNAAEQANERIARASQQDIHSGNSTDSDSGGSNQQVTHTSSGRPVRSTRAATVISSSSSSKRSLESVAASAAAVSNASSARSKRRRAIDDDLDFMFNPTVLEDLLNDMMRHKDGWPFDRPITKSEAPDYHKIIKRPMDLGTIRSNLNRMKYSCNQEVIDDILLVFQNCATYNNEEAEEFVAGVRLEKYFRKQAKDLGLLNNDNDTDSCTRKPAKKARRTL